MISNFIQQLTHDNDLFNDQWSDIFDRIKQESVSDDVKLVLNALGEYVLAESSDQSSSELKYTFITMVIERMIRNNKSIEINDLLKIFTHVLEQAKIDRWNLHFLQMIYERFQIGEQLCKTPLKTNLIEQILESFQKKIFTSISSSDEINWQRFLTQSVFSTSIDGRNILNKRNIITNMKTIFQQFYQHAVQQSQSSSIWLEIAKILNESSPKIFTLDTQSNIVLFDSNLPIETISSNYIAHQIQSCKDNIELIKTNSNPLITTIEQLILSNRYKDAYLLLLKLIIPNLSSIDLELFLRKMISLCSIVQQQELFCSEILDPFVRALADLKGMKTLALLFFDLSLAILKLHCIEAPELSRHLLRRKDFYPWKDMVNGLIDCLKTCILYDTLVREANFSSLDRLEDIMEIIANRAQSNPTICKALHPIAVEAILRWSHPELIFDTHVYRMGIYMFQLIDLEQVNEDICIKFINALQNRVNDSENEEFNQNNRVFFTTMCSHLAVVFEKLQTLSTNIHSLLVNLFQSVLNYPLYDENQNMKFEFIIMATMIIRVVLTISIENDARLYEPLLDRIYHDAKYEEKTYLYQWWVQLWLIMGAKIPNIAIDHVEQLLEYTNNSKEMNFIGLLTTIQMLRPELFYSHIDNLVNFLLNDQGKYVISLTALFQLIIRDKPELIFPKHIEQIFSSIESFPFNNGLCMFIQSLSSIANNYPHLFYSNYDKLFQSIIKTQNLFVYQSFQKYFVISIITSDDIEANERLNLFIEVLKDENCSKQMQKEIFYTCLLIGLKNKQLLINRRHDFVIPEGVLLLNYLDDTVIDDVDQAEIQRAQNELQQIELYLNQTMANRIESNINVYSSNIPSWASAVAELLNRRNNKDWRLLARQLGFTLTEIRHWLMQKNPCMVLLDEWFTTHETDEAVLSLLKALGEIDRHDVEQIIQEAVLATGQIIPTDLSIDIKRRPLINLSFHSSKKDLVTKLKEHLAAAGYICQMYDEHIELNTTHTYICGAKVIICCVNRFYTQSENCCHVFQLILNMKKPFLLLHMDEQTWLPSEGIFQSIFQDYSSIEFANSQNDINWSEKKFIELLAHIRYYVAPDSDIIKEQYYHWFVPRLNDLIFLKSASDFISFDNIPLVVVHPQIIISYQWDSQKDVLHLYKLMTQLGYRIWLDLFQMTGGGTLTEKYDSTIRHATCLLVCLTPKYMKSMHCQHQLSLASTLKKPILPLLLEETRAWAPSNLKLSLPIEKLSLIDFQQSNANDRWTGKQFEMLLAYLEQIVSTVQTNKSRYFLDIYRPASASRNRTDFDQSPKRPSSAPLVPQSQACSVM